MFAANARCVASDFFRGAGRHLASLQSPRKMANRGANNSIPIAIAIKIYVDFELVEIEIEIKITATIDCNRCCNSNRCHSYRFRNFFSFLFFWPNIRLNLELQHSHGVLIIEIGRGEWNGFDRASSKSSGGQLPSSTPRFLVKIMFNKILSSRLNHFPHFL